MAKRQPTPTRLPRQPRPREEKTALFAPHVERLAAFWEEHPEALREMQEAILGAKIPPKTPEPEGEQTVDEEADAQRRDDERARRDAYLRDCLDWARRIGRSLLYDTTDAASRARVLADEYSDVVSEMRTVSAHSPRELRLDQRRADLEEKVIGLISMNVAPPISYQDEA